MIINSVYFNNNVNSCHYLNGTNLNCNFKSNQNVDKIEISSKSKEITFDDFKNLLIKKGLNQTEYGDYTLNLPLKDKFKGCSKYDLVTSIKLNKLIDRRYPQSQIKNMHKFVNLHNGKYSDYWKNNIFDLFTTYTLITNNDRGYIKGNDKEKNILLIPEGILDSIVDVVKRPPEKEFYRPLRDFKVSSAFSINLYLMTNLAEKSDFLEKDIEKLSNYLSSHEVKTPFKAYRGGYYYFLDTIQMDNGESLGETMKEIQENPDDNKIAELKENVRKNKYTKVNPQFVSTSVFENFKERQIYFNFNITEKTKGIFVEPVNLDSLMNYEYEFLMDKGQKIQILDIDLVDYPAKKEEKQWLITANVLPNE